MAEPTNLPFIRVQLCLRKKDEVSDEFFHNYWKDNHVKLALENKNFVDRVIRYNQVRSTPMLVFIQGLIFNSSSTRAQS
jgi:hypothetical protein